MADEGKTFHVKIGALVNAILKADSGMQPWNVNAPDPAVLAPAANPPAGAGETTRGYKAVGAGTAAIAASDRPACAPGQVCAQFIRGFRATVIVDPA